MKRLMAWILPFFVSCSLVSEEYVVGDLMGQFGNQMFIIAATTSLALDHGATPLFPSLVNEKDFNIPYNYQNVFYHLNAYEPPTPIEFYYLEKNFHFDPIPYQPNMLIRGWFQSEKYFKHHKEEIIALFQPPPTIQSYLENKYQYILDHPKTVSIHFRTYDVELPEVAKCYYNCDLDYYEKAIYLFPEDSLFIVFSNQIEWCKSQFTNIPRDIIYIENESFHTDFYLMAQCKDNIICNSSFSWWAAYLNLNPEKKVIVPPSWFNPEYLIDTEDLIPSEWIILE